MEARPVAFTATTSLQAAELPVCSGSIAACTERGRAHEVQVAPWKPRYLTVDFGGAAAGDSDDIYELFIESDDDFEAVVSMQNASCPVMDAPDNVKFKGASQVVSKKGTLRFRPAELGSKLYVVIVLVATGVCERAGPKDEMVSTFHLALRRGMPTSGYVVPILGMLASFLAVGGATFAVRALSLRVKHKNLAPARALSGESVYEGDDADLADDLLIAAAPAIGGSGGGGAAQLGWDVGLSKQHRKAFKLRHRSRAELKVNSLARKPPEAAAAKSQGYWKYLIVILLFYWIPVVQLVVGTHLPASLRARAPAAAAPPPPPSFQHSSFTRQPPR